MLNLKIVMMPISLISSLLLGLHLLFQTITATGDVVISYPETGSVVEGVVEIHGSVPAEDFSSARVSYSYMGDEDNWFLIARIDQSVESGILATWDTSTITDGSYKLRLTMKTTSGTRLETIVSDIQVANYSHLAAQATESEDNEQAATQTPADSVTRVGTTPLPANPVTISDQEIKQTILVGGLSGIAAVFIFIVWTTIKNYLNRR